MELLQKYYLDNNLGPLDASINTKYAKVVRRQLGLDR